MAPPQPYKKPVYQVTLTHSEIEVCCCVQSAAVLRGGRWREGKGDPGVRVDASC